MQYRPALLAVILALFLGVTAAPARASQKVTLTLFSVPRRDLRNVDDQADLAIMNRFLELHPEVDLGGFQGVAAPGISGDSKYLLALAGGVAPDVMYVNFRQSDSYISNGFLYP